MGAISPVSLSRRNFGPSSKTRQKWVKDGPVKSEAKTLPPNHGFEDTLFGDVNQKAALYITGGSSGSSADDYGGGDLKLLEFAKHTKKVRSFV